MGSPSILTRKFFNVFGELFSRLFKRTRKIANAIMHMDEREKFDDDFIIRLIRRMTLNERNDDKEIKEVQRILTWVMALRKAILEAVSMIRS